VTREKTGSSDLRIFLTAALRLLTFVALPLWLASLFVQFDGPQAVFGWEQGQDREVRALQTRCTQGDHWACEEFGRALTQGWNGDQSPSRWTEGLTALRIACDNGRERACIFGAAAASQEAGSQEDIEFGLTLLKSGCKQGLQEACVELGTVLVGTAGDPKKNAAERDRERAAGLKILQEACAKKSARGCWALAQSTATREGSALSPTLSACTLGEALACEELARSKRGGQPPVFFFEKGCQLGSISSCREAAELLIHSDEDSSFRAGLEIAVKFCSMGDAELCFTLSDASPIPNNPIGAMRARVALQSEELWEQGNKSLDSFCGYGWRSRCEEGLKYKHQAQLREKLNSQEMIRTARACDAVDTDLQPDSCKEYQAFLDEMCSLGVGQACNDLGLRLLRAKEKGGLQHLVDACDRGYGRACYNLSRLPRGRQAADKTSYELLRLACGGGYSLAC